MTTTTFTVRAALPAEAGEHRVTVGNELELLALVRVLPNQTDVEYMVRVWEDDEWRTIAHGYVRKVDAAALEVNGEDGVFLSGKQIFCIAWDKCATAIAKIPSIADPSTWAPLQILQLNAEAEDEQIICASGGDWKE